MRWNLSSVPTNFIMSTRILYGILLILSVAMLLFLAGYLCFQLGYGLLTTFFYKLAGNIMLFAFGMLLLAAAAALIAAIFGELRAYFRQEAAALRRVWALQAQKIQLVQRSLLEYRQLQYLSQAKRQRLSAADNRKQLRTLYDAINRELQAVRTQLPADSYKALHKSLHKHHKHADAEAMLALRQQIPCR